MARNGGIGKTAIKRVILNLENTYLGLENGRQLLIGGGGAGAGNRGRYWEVGATVSSQTP